MYITSLAEHTFFDPNFNSGSIVKGTKTRPGCFCAKYCLDSEEMYPWYPPVLVVVGCSGLYCAVLGLVKLCWAVSGYIGLYWAALGCTGLDLAVLGCSGLPWAVLTVQGCDGL